jgi:hypothetical protein
MLSKICFWSASILRSRSSYEPETPFSVMTRSGFSARIASHMALTCSSSISSILFQCSSLLISMLVCDSPFLYSKVQSNRIIRGFSILLLIFGCVISLLSITPSNTLLSSISPPGIFSTRAYRLMSTSCLPPPTSWDTIRTALSARSHMSFDHLEENFVPIELDMSPYIDSSLWMSTGREISSIMSKASARARLKAEMMTTGWIFRSSCGRACARISPALSSQQ